MPNFLMIVAILLLGVCLAAQGSPPRDAAPGLSQSTREMSNRVARMEHANASKPHPRSRPGPAGPHGKQAMPSRARALRRLRATRRRLSQATETSPAPPCPSSPPPEGAMAPQGCPWPPPAFCEAGVDNDSSIGTEPLPGCPGGDPLPLATDSYFPYGMDYYYDWDDLVGEFLCPTTEPGEGEDPAMRLGCTWPAADICSEPWDGYYGIYYGGFDDGFYGEMPPWYGYDGEDTWDFEDYFEESDDFFDSDDVRERMDDGSDDFFEGSEPGDYYYDYYDLDLPLWDYYGMAPPDYLFIHPGCPGGLRVSCCFPEADPGNCMPEDCSFDIDYAPFDFGAEEGASFFPGIEEDDWGMPLAFDGTSGEPRTTAPEERPSECWRADMGGFGQAAMVFDKGSFDPLTRCLDADISSDDSSFLMDDFECLRLLATTPEKVVQCSAEHDTCATQRYVDPSNRGREVYISSGCAVSADTNTSSIGTRTPSYVTLEETSTLETSYGLCTNDECNSALDQSGERGLTCYVTDFESMDSPDELSDPTTHPCYDLISSTTLTWECVELLGTAAVKEVQCGHTADVCTAVKFSKAQAEGETEDQSTGDALQSLFSGDDGTINFFLHMGCALETMCPIPPGIDEPEYASYPDFPAALLRFLDGEPDGAADGSQTEATPGAVTVSDFETVAGCCSTSLCTGSAAAAALSAALGAVVALAFLCVM